ncbi:hypothetical protein [Pseudomonas sp. MS19]|uniref:hypothetical protein n=1 Tax=Pseudomonas sp. MS19 TaxID=2579939 RepID=UPI00156282EF|nr:hypothetical protein [Pseudomonas sp. MS19]NRH29180.1 hypothetical protein [Pseudomonas sp. MS19]
MPSTAQAVIDTPTSSTQQHAQRLCAGALLLTASLILIDGLLSLQPTNVALALLGGAAALAIIPCSNLKPTGRQPASC